VLSSIILSGYETRKKQSVNESNLIVTSIKLLEISSWWKLPFSSVLANHQTSAYKQKQFCHSFKISMSSRKTYAFRCGNRFEG